MRAIVKRGHEIWCGPLECLFAQRVAINDVLGARVILIHARDPMNGGNPIPSTNRSTMDQKFYLDNLRYHLVEAEKQLSHLSPSIIFSKADLEAIKADLTNARWAVRRRVPEAVPKSVR